MSPSPDSLPDRPLAESIAVATRSSHTRLNKSIIARLPLVSQATDPSPYVTGLLHITPIYLTFETLWKSILDTPAQDGPRQDESSAPISAVATGDIPTTASPNAAMQLRQPVVCDRLRKLLQELRLPGLMRSSRLRADIQAMTGWPDHIVEEQLHITAETGRLSEFTAHIKRSVEHRPHVLVAYSYILFMALFAGGRYIRATLESAGESFWNQKPSPIKPGMIECGPRESGKDQSTKPRSESGILPTTDTSSEKCDFPLSFFHFDTPEDGEDLKREFKSRLLDAEGVLTHQEKHDIVQESVCIFDNMELLVAQLDKACAGEEDDVSAASLPALMGKSMAMRFRDSVAVTKDRAARSLSRMSSSSSDSSSICTVVKARRAYGADAATSTTGLTREAMTSHPPILASAAATELCPALKSMRFDANLPIPGRGGTGTGEGSQGIHYTNWLLMAAFGAIVVGAIMTTRREMIAA